MDLRGKAAGMLEFLREKFSPFYGITLAILSSIVAGLSSVLMKMSVNASSMMMLVYMFGFQATFALITIVYKKNDLICVKGERLWFLQRLLLDGFGMYFLAQSLRYISASDMTAILFCQPVLISLVSPIFTNEKFRVKNILLALLAVVGVAFICRPSFIFGTEPGDEGQEGQRLLGVMWAAICCVTYTYLAIVSKKMPRTPVTVAMFNIGVVIFIPVTILEFYPGAEGLPFCGWDSVTVMSAMIFGVFTTLLESASIKKEKITTFSTSITTQIIFIMLLEVLFLNLTPLWSDYLGAVFIIASIILTVLSRDREDDSPRNLHIILTKPL